MTEASVFIIDDDGSMRDSLDFLLSSSGFSVKKFDGAPRFLEFLPQIQTGCILTDIRMPQIDGMTLLKQVKQEKPNLSVIMMTGHGDIPLAVEAMKLGATDFIEKPFDDERLIGSIKEALAGAGFTAKSSAVSSEIADRISTLSPRERQILDGLVAGLPNKAIARTYDISPRTVEVYRANVMTKMQATSLSELVRFALRAGLLVN